MKKFLNISKYVICIATLMVLSLLITSNPDAASTHKGSLETNRATGVVTYQVAGINLTTDTSLKMQVTNTSTKAVWQKEITLNEENCIDGVYTGTVNFSDLKYAFANYTVTAVLGEETVAMGNVDFTIHTGKTALKVTGNNGDVSRTVTFTSTEAAGDVLVPGTDNQISIQIWNKNRAESTASTVVASTALSGTKTWTFDTTKAGNYYGTWCAKAVVTNTKNWTGSYTLASTEYAIVPTATSFTTKKTATLEKKQAFGIYLKGLKNAFGIKGISFRVYNSKGAQVATIKGTSKAADGSYYYASVTMKKLKYNLDRYTVKAVMTDNVGKTYELGKTTSSDQRLKKGTFTVTKKKNATCTYKLTNAYVPGYFKKVEVVLYQIKSGKTKKIGTYKAKASSGKKTYSVTVYNETKGTFRAKIYGTTQWGSKRLLGNQKFTLKKSDMGKNGWYYEKYNGKKYKFYYVNNKKQTDLTKVLKLKKSSSAHTNNFYIEVNRAACVVTVYMYNDETDKYDIPINTFTVCVGRDTATNAGAGGLNTKTSYTPLGNYSICTNGQSVKYTLKPMYEPDGSTVYARWATHIVGNVYFHSIAVGSQSHYALPAYRFNLLGTACSAGCIRMAVADAKWIYDYASTGTKVKIVKGSTKKPGPLGKAKTIKAKAGINYDPTDPGVPESRKKKDYKAKKISGYRTKSGKKVGY